MCALDIAEERETEETWNPGPEIFKVKKLPMRGSDARHPPTATERILTEHWATSSGSAPRPMAQGCLTIRNVETWVRGRTCQS